MEFNATFLVSAISFILFTIIMNKIFYKPLENIMSERQNFLDNTKHDAQDSEAKADAILKDREDKLNRSIVDSKNLVADKINQANENSKTLTDGAKQKSLEEITSAKSILQKEAEENTTELRAKVKDLAEAISSKVLGMEVKIENTDDEKLNRILI